MKNRKWVTLLISLLLGIMLTSCDDAIPTASNFTTLPQPPIATATPLRSYPIAQTATPSPTPDAASMIHSYTFTDMNHGRIETGKGYFATADGGASWQQTTDKPSNSKALMPTPSTIKTFLNMEGYSFCVKEKPFAGSFTSIDMQTGWAFCTGHPGAHYSDGVQLFKTEDGGQHWQLLTEQVPYGAWGLTDFVFSDRLHGWIAPRYENGVTATEDGGRTWHSVPIIGFVKSWGSIQFLSPQQGHALVATSPTGDSRDLIIATEDGGQNWRVIYSSQ